MTWALKPKLPGGSSFSGQMVYNTVDIEVEDTFKDSVEWVAFKILGQYDYLLNGFESIIYKKDVYTQKKISIMLVGSLNHNVKNQLHRLAIGLNGSGMILQWKDDIVSGTVASPVTYECRWLNAGKFVDNSEILCGGRIDLISFSES